MNDSVAHVRARWTRELTDAAIRFLQGNPGETEIPTMDLHGETLPDLRGIRIESTQFDGMVMLQGVFGITVIRMLIALPGRS